MNPNTIKIRFKRLTPAAVIPKRGSASAAGYDLTAIRITGSEDQPGLIRIGTGIAVEIPEGYAGFIFPRSSVYKTRSILSNCVGVVDSDYRGEIMAAFFSWNRDIFYHVGDRFAQMVILPVPAVEFLEAEELSATERGTGGYGSTGR